MINFHIAASILYPNSSKASNTACLQSPARRVNFIIRSTVL